MTASAKPAKGVLPSAQLLLRETFLTTWNLRAAVYGYTGWLLIPIIIGLFAHNLSAPYANYLLILQEAFGLVLGLWVTAAIIIYVAVTTTKPTDTDIDYTSIGKAAGEKILGLLIIQVFILCLVLFGTLVFVVPGLVAWVWTAFAAQESVLNQGGLLAAFKRSYELTRGRFWAVLWRLFVGNALLVTLILLAFTIYLLIGLHGSSGSIMPTLYARPYWLEVGFSLMLLPITPLAVIFHLRLYFAAKTSYSAANV